MQLFVAIQKHHFLFCDRSSKAFSSQDACVITMYMERVRNISTETWIKNRKFEWKEKRRRRRKGKKIKKQCTCIIKINLFDDLPWSIKTISTFLLGETSIMRIHSQNNGVSAHSFERFSREQTDSSAVFSGWDNSGDVGYLNDIWLIWATFASSSFAPEIYLS